MTTVTVLPAGMRTPLRRELNTELMVKWIDDDLPNRCSLDIDECIVFYDETGIFEFALDTMPDAALLKRLAENTTIRYWSLGID
jgi:hypothetical protein